MTQHAWTTAELEAFEVIELPTRQAFTGLSSGLITIDADICLDVDVDLDVDADVDLDLDGDCGDSDSGGSNGGSKGGKGGSCK